MNRKLLLIILLLAMVATHAAEENFAHRASLAGGYKEGFNRVILPHDIIERSRNSLGDLRIYAGDVPVPYFTDIESEEKSERIRAEIIDYSNGEPERLYFRTEVPVRARYIDLLIPDRNFERKVMIYGSNDNRNWEKLTEQTIFDYSWKTHLRKTRISLETEKEFSEYRADIYPEKLQVLRNRVIAVDDLEIHDISINISDLKYKGVRVTTREQAQQPEYKVALEEYDLNVDKKQTVCEFAIPYPAGELRLSINDPFYFRNYELFIKKDNTYNRVRSGMIFRDITNQLDDNSIPIETGYDRQYRLLIHNQDNEPLTIKELEYSYKPVYCYFYLEAVPEKLMFYIGNDDSVKPVYDIAHLKGTKIPDLNIVYTSMKIDDNPSYSGRSVIKNIKKIGGEFVVRILLITIAFILIIIIARLLSGKEKS